MLNESDLKKIEPTGPSRFTFNGNIINEIGEESISNPFIAIAELIKNSYDADSKNVIIKFSDINKKDYSKITISDDGAGMDSEDIRNKWMDVGSPHKKEINRTPAENRVPVGAKGIGRFASHCLGNKLTIITGKEKEIKGYKLSFDWREYDEKNKATDIDNPTNKFNKKRIANGTTLIIESLKKDWNDKEKLRNLLKDLYLLNPPIGYPKNFKIKTDITKNCKDLKKIDRNFLEKSAYHLCIKLTKKKDISYEFYKGGNRIKKESVQLDESLSCGDVQFDLYFYYKIKKSWEQWIGKELTKKDLDEIKNMLEDYGGIKLYRDKFRVKPYGDKNADWIGLDKWSRDQSMVPGNTQTIGVVSISKESNPEILDTTSREGVITNPQYFDLVKFITTSIKRFVELRGEQETSKAKAKKSRKKVKSKKVKVETPKVEEPISSPPEVRFIDVKGDYPQNFYYKLEKEVNDCYTAELPNATFFLCRKLIENLLFNILEKKYKHNQEKWWNAEYDQPWALSRLIKNLHQNRKDFKPNVKKYIEKAHPLLQKLRNEVNPKAHNIYDYLGTKEDLDKFKINDVVQLLINVYNNI